MKTHAVKLPYSAAPELLLADLAKVPASAWQSHYNHKEYEGDWAVAPLRSVAGHPDIIYAVPNSGQSDFYKNTSLLENCLAFKAAVSFFQCPVGAVRLMRLGAGARILEHSDYMETGEVREIRLHIPIQTNPGVQFWVNHQLVPMLPGEFWFADFSMPHRVENQGDTDRIHLVIDCIANEWLDALILRSAQIQAITAFLQKIGIPVEAGEFTEPSFLPGILIRNGGIIYDTKKLDLPGDLLHEAGHIAVAETGVEMQGDVTKDDPNAMGTEIAAILWSFAALKAIGLPESVVFHGQGYKGHSDWYIDNFRSGQYIGLPLLEWMGLTAGPEKAKKLGVEPFPNMLNWVRPRS